ncbi:integrin alpha-PS3-like [Anopheles albimanus]|uniref:integrin alpha-PS3-like n=1 Tax=Anopheles albimanus TaxID=7167 RepID=UPI001640F4F0|nr:integrin alpha-PS3-like [Anopheles albimanus]
MALIRWLMLWPLVFFGSSSGIEMKMFGGPNYTFRKPLSSNNGQQSHGSNFGYSINLRTTGVMVGAPRLKLSNETTSIYQCRIQTSDCHPYSFDGSLNTHEKTKDKEFDALITESPMFGASIDGLGLEKSWHVVCAPKRIGYASDECPVHGACYVITDDATFKIDPKAQRNKEKCADIVGLVGFSAHVTDDGKEVLIGAPGWETYGTVVRYRHREANKEHVNCSVEHNSQTIQLHDSNSSITGYEFCHESSIPPNHNFYPHLVAEEPTSTSPYLGFAISSGQFLKKEPILYVASAPQAKDGMGQVLIFDYIEQPSELEVDIRVLQSFTGHQIGEYFGYALLTEDFNNDGLPDLAIAAPMHSRTREFDNGVVYVYQNKGGLNFDLQTILQSSYDFGGRFGTSLGKIGDINRDGYGDMAVGAPHEGDGVVYIFLGSEDGIKTKPSQVIKAPLAIKVTRQPMFGFAISRGVDIDGNGYNDLAIGAPNAEVVYVYRAYPIVQVKATISSSPNHIPIEGGSIEIEICFTREFILKDRPSFDIELEYSLQLDLTYRRASFQNNAINSSYNIISIGDNESCQKFGILINDSSATIRMEKRNRPKPVRIEMEFNLSSKSSPPPDSQYCVRCASLDPNLANNIIKYVSIDFCDDSNCHSNLRLSSILWVDIPEPFVVGSRETATLYVQVENVGESAHLPKLELTVMPNLSPVKFPPGCKSSKINNKDMSVVCALNDRLALSNGSNVVVPFTFGMSELESDKYLTVKANVSSINGDSQPSNNKDTLELKLKHHSNIGVVSTTSKEKINMNHYTGKLNMTERVSLHNFGPSYLKGAALCIDIPLSYVSSQKNGKQKKCNIVDKTDVIIKGEYTNHTFTLKRTEKRAYMLDNSNAKHKFNGIKEAITKPPSNRNIKISKSHESTNINSCDSTVIGGASLTDNDVIFFNCAENRSKVECASYTIEIPTLKASRIPAIIEIQYRIDLDEIKACFGEEKKAFAIEIFSDFCKKSDIDPLKTLNTTHCRSKTIVKNDSPDQPLLISLSSSLVGLCLLILISYILREVGFFKRPMKEELEKRILKEKHHDDLQGDDRDKEDCVCDGEEP